MREEGGLTAVSLFAGVGGFDIALERAGVEVVAAVEIDDKARGVLAHRFPHVRLFSDVCEVTGGDLRAAGFVPERGVLTGGFPCQDLSVAGKRAGLAGSRSGLFWEVVRLIDETHPAWIVIENVPGLLSSNGGRDMGTVIGALVERGYGVSWRVLDAQHFGVPQRRRRVVIVGRAGDDGRASSEVLAIAESLRGDPAEGEQAGQEVAGTPGGGSGSRGWSPDTDRIGEDGTGRGTPIVATVMRMREGKEGGGKGPLIRENQSLTIATANDQVLFTDADPIAFSHLLQRPRSGRHQPDAPPLA